MLWSLSLILSNRKISSSLSTLTRYTLGLTLVIAFNLLASNFVIITAQQQQLLSQPQGIGNGTSEPFATTAITTTAVPTRFQSTNDSFSVLVPDGWTIHDLHNRGSMLSEELGRGYGILAQICPEEEQIQRGAVSTSNNSCQGVQEVVHVIRYPDLNTRIPAANNATSMVGSTITIEDVLSYTLQKLQEIGYRNIQILNNTDTQVNITNSQTNQTVATLPAKFVEMTYSFGGIVGSNELRKSYFILTASAATTPDDGTVKGYSIFYEDNGSSNNNTTAAPTSGITSTSAAATSSSLVSLSLPSSVKQVLDSFELIISQVPAGPLTSRIQTPEETGGFGGGGNAGGVGGGSSGDDVVDGSAGDIDDEEDDAGDDSCHPSYSDTCIPPPPPDLNCDDIEDTNFEVVGSDPHGFDGDNDGIGCETGTVESGGGGGDDVDDADDGDDGGDSDDDGGEGDGGVGADDEESDEDGGSDDEGSSRCPNGYHRSPSGDCERVTDTSGMPRCPNGYHRSPDGDCERVR